MRKKGQVSDLYFCNKVDFNFDLNITNDLDSFKSNDYEFQTFEP